MNLSANGVQGCLLHIGVDRWVFRVYSKPGIFIDYDLLHSDLCVTITDEDAVFYSDQIGNNKLDHSPQTLGITK